MAEYGGKQRGQLSKAISRSESKDAQLQRFVNNRPQTDSQMNLIHSIQKKPNNTGLPVNLKTDIENLSGYSMDDVKVYYNSDKPVQFQALTYAQGNNIHVGFGQEKHLPHEVWRVVQQKRERVQPTMQMRGGNINDNEGLVKEADLMGMVVQLKKVSNPSNNVTQLYFEEPWFQALPAEEQETLRILKNDSDAAFEALPEQIRKSLPAYSGSSARINPFLRAISGRTRKGGLAEIEKIKDYNPKNKASAANLCTIRSFISKLYAAYGVAQSNVPRNAQEHIDVSDVPQNYASPTIRGAITVYRGCGFNLYTNTGVNLLDKQIVGIPNATSRTAVQNHALQNLVGQTFFEPGFLSTSANKKYAERFANSGVLLIITVPAPMQGPLLPGAHPLPAKSAFYFSRKIVAGKTTEPPESQQLRNEDEILFPPEQSCYITKVVVNGKRVDIYAKMQ